jgi:hypothetical protein
MSEIKNGDHEVKIKNKAWKYENFKTLETLISHKSVVLWTKKTGIKTIPIWAICHH